MKKIYSILLAAFALLAFIPVANALDDDPPYTEKNNIAYSKYATGPVNGIYTIHLNTFVTGEKTVTVSKRPADVVLVLDVSGSMNDSYTTTYTYTARTEQNYTYNNGGGYYYLHTDGQYYLVEQGGGGGNRNLHFSDGTSTYYLVGTGVTGTAPRGYGRNDTIWRGVLYSRSSQSVNRMTALKGAVKDFIDVIQSMDPGEEGKHNQISIVKFATNTETSLTGNHKYSGYHSTSGNTMTPATGGNYFNSTDYYNLSEIVTGFTEVSDAGVVDLKAAVDALQPGGATASDFGMNKALDLINTLYTNGAPSRQSNKTVVFFTDGVPTYGNSYQETVAEAAISAAKSIKSKVAYHDDEENKDVNVSVYSVGVFGSMTGTGMTAAERDRYMHRVSSDYPSASGMGTNPDEGGTGSDTAGYYQDASNSDLSSIFRNIASAAGGSGATTVTAEAATTVDVVSQSFDLPDGASTDITVQFANCNGKDDNGYLTFDLENLLDNPDEGENGHVSIEIQGNKVTASGFDYTGNWCGFDESLGENGEYRGMMLMLLIPIEMSPDAVGGNNVGTNGPESGIYVNDEPVIKFDIPEINLPTNLHIKKEIADGECATFEIYRKKLTASNWETTPFKTVIVIGGNNDNTVKLLGLDPTYLYKIVEAGWSWTYDLDHVEDYEGNEIEGEITSDKLITNPFIFVNKKKDRQIRHAESAVYNDFRTAGEVEGIDSKPTTTTTSEENTQEGN